MVNEIHKNIISKSQSDDIRRVDYFKDGMYSNLDIPATLDFYYIRYVKQIKNFTDISKDTIVSDIGAGFGWLSFAFALNTKAKILAIEPNERRLEAGIEISKILDIKDRIEWRVGSLGELPMQDRESNISYCIEVLEHVRKDPATIQDLCRVTSEFVVLTTPNLWFPKIAHDTQLPFCHWLPIPLRKIYAKLFNRSEKENDNLFWSPLSLSRNMNGFKRVSSWLHYSNYNNYLATFPYYLPYGKGSFVDKPGKSKKFYYGLISRIGIKSYFMAPNLAGVYKRI
jgi:ubiquinone/menaquinone biosynthesis C-methylase UbiE